jgi:hypothetical protein
MTGELLEQLRFPLECINHLDVVVTPEGEVLGQGEEIVNDDRSSPIESVLARWSRPRAAPITRAGVIGQDRRPDLWKRIRYSPTRLAVSPDGRFTVAVRYGESGGLVFWDTRSLAEMGRFWPRGGVNYASFTPDGRSLLVHTSTGLALLPWPELMAFR